MMLRVQDGDSLFVDLVEWRTCTLTKIRSGLNFAGLVRPQVLGRGARC